MTPASGPVCIDNRYVLEERLGSGGMGEVYRARDLIADRNRDPDPFVAIKVLKSSIRGDEEAMLGLQREASRAQRLTHENIVRVHHFGSDAQTCYLTMELLRGRSLEQLIQEHAAGMPLEAAMPLVRGLCNALAYAHREGIVHSDIKPSNVFLTDRGIVKVLDFGIAMRARSEPAPGGNGDTLYNPRRMGALSPQYACLEAFMGLPADPRDDVFSAACVIYELLSGRHPYGGLEAPQALDSHKKPARLSVLSARQNAALMSALALRRSERCASIEAFVQEFCSAPESAPPRVLLWGTVGAGVIVLAALGILLIGRDAAQEVTPDPEPVVTSDPKPSDVNQRASTSSSPVVQQRMPEPQERLLEPPIRTLELPEPAVRPKSPALTVEGGTTVNNCAALDRQWAALSCEQRRACFAERANIARIAALVAAPEILPVYEARAAMYERLAQSQCNEQDAVRAREYESFRRRFPQIPVQ